MDFNLGILYAIISMIGFGVGNAMAQVPIRLVGVKKSIFYRNLLVSIFLLILLFFFRPLFNIKYVMITVVISLIGYFAVMSFFRALKTDKVGVILPIANSSLVFTVLFSVLFYGETLSKIQVFSIFLILIGIVLISINFKDFKRSHLFSLASGIPFALLTCFLWGLISFLYKIPVVVIGPIFTAFIIEFGIFIFSGIHLLSSKENFSIDRKIFLYLFFVAFFVLVECCFLI